MSTTANWIEVDRKGLADLIASHPKSKIIFELVQNAWDEEGVTRVEVTVRSNGHGTHEVSVTDDSPDGYTDIRHAWTLYAPSKKKADPTQRGRFNSGCKMVLALASEARVVSTQSAVGFDKQGRRSLRRRREKGTEFVGTFRMSKTEAKEACQQALRLIPPEGIVTTITLRTNEKFDELALGSFRQTVTLEHRKPMRVADNVSLPTILADDEGVLRQKDRNTSINLYEPLPGEEPWLYEMGIPVVELVGGEPWHIDVQQRVPLNQDRDNVTPRYLQKVRCAVIKAAHLDLTEESAKAVWATDATEDYACNAETMDAVLDLRFGRKRVSFDPSDQEANKLAVARGYTVVHGGSMTAKQWTNARVEGVIKPAGEVTPSPSLLSKPDGISRIHEHRWTRPMQKVARYSIALCAVLSVREDLTVEWYADPRLAFQGFWSHAKLGLNLHGMNKIMDAWEEGDVRPLLELLLHEFAHETESDHLSSKFADEIARLGALLFGIAIDETSRGEAIKEEVDRVALNSYNRGWADAVQLYAVWGDGQQFVGVTRQPLKRVLDEGPDESMRHIGLEEARKR